LGADCFNGEGWEKYDENLCQAPNPNLEG